MRSVNRGEEPVTLKRNSERWTKELLDTRETGDQDAIKTAEGRYKKDGIREALKDMYNDLCCYCESTVSANSFGHIEHRKPKREFPKYAFNWDNLHWACEKCNNAKADQWDTDNPILDPTVDTEIIPTHLSIVPGLRTIEFHPETDSGKTTIDHADLNRLDLAKARRKVCNYALALKNALKAVEESSSDIKIENIKNLINEMRTEEYGSCIEIIFEQF